MSADPDIIGPLGNGRGIFVHSKRQSYSQSIEACIATLQFHPPSRCSARFVLRNSLDGCDVLTS